MKQGGLKTGPGAQVTPPAIISFPQNKFLRKRLSIKDKWATPLPYSLPRQDLARILVIKRANVSAPRNKKNAPAGESGNRAKRWPDNVQVFHIADLPVDTLDQGMMRLFRKIADEKGWTVEEVIAGAIEQWVERCKAEQNLEGKIIRFPNRKRRSEKQVIPGSAG
jgi:hypothetical protein